MSVVGISPSDLVSFVKFTSTVISALKENGGSHTKYQEAAESVISVQSSWKDSVIVAIRMIPPLPGGSRLRLTT